MIINEAIVIVSSLNYYDRKSLDTEIMTFNPDVVLEIRAEIESYKTYYDTKKAS